MMLSKKAWSNEHGQDSSYFLGWEEYQKNPYHATTNANGIIQMGLAENQLSFDLLETWLQNNPDASGFKNNGRFIFRDLALFQDYHGLPAFKNAMVELMSHIRGNKVTFNPNNLVLTAGATSANETIIFCLADPGDAFLIPTPYYPGFDRDLKWRTGVEIVPIKCKSSTGFRITNPALEEAYQSAKKQNLRVKGILVTNPSNPLGTTLSRHELNLLLAFVSAHDDVHLVSDEIYAGTFFGDQGEFISVMEPLKEEDAVWKRVHVVSSLSKDMGLPGFRVGSIYSNDTEVVSAATKMSSFGLVSSQTQHLLACLLSDTSFVSAYVEENAARIRRRRETMAAGLESCGIRCLESDAGLFCWVDMSHLLKERSLEGEMELWKRMLYEVRINVSPGSACHCDEPGWFRMCFANMDEDTLMLAMRRLKDFVAHVVDERLAHRRRARSRWLPRLGYANRESDIHGSIVGIIEA